MQGGSQCKEAAVPGGIPLQHTPAHGYGTAGAQWWKGQPVGRIGYPPLKSGPS